MPDASHGTSSYFSSPAIDQAFCGIGAGFVSTLCMHPLDLLKVKFQVTSSPKSRPNSVLQSNASTPSGPSAAGTGAGAGAGERVGAVEVGGRGKWVGGEIYEALREIVKRDGWRGLYRGLSPNIIGNAASWGLYFLWYTKIKDYMANGDPDAKLSAGRHLLASAESGAITAVMTNPLWVVKTRMFTSRKGGEGAYRDVFDGLYKIARTEGVRGLWNGTVLALVGVSNGAIQFMTYEELKKWRKEVKKRKIAAGKAGDDLDVQNLTNTEYILMSGGAKLAAIALTYPYQVIRSRMQNQVTMPSIASPYPPPSPFPPPRPSPPTNVSTSYPSPSPQQQPYKSIPDCIIRTYKSEGLLAFYRGLTPNAIRILPGTCVTFVVYENLARLLREAGRRKDDGGRGGGGGGVVGGGGRSEDQVTRLEEAGKKRWKAASLGSHGHDDKVRVGNGHHDGH